MICSMFNSSFRVSNCTSSKHLCSVILATVLLTISAQSFSSKKMEFSIAGGFNQTHIKNTSLTISPYETDSVLIKQLHDSGMWKVGIGSYFFDEHREFFNSFLLELNFYRSEGDIDGVVWQYQLPQFNNYGVYAPYSNTRLVVDVKPGLFTWNAISPYLILGIGATWNSMSYQETVAGVEDQPGSNLILNNKISTHFAYDLGVGSRVTLDKHLSVSIEYLYTYLSQMSPGREETNSVQLTSAPIFRLYNQALLFGLTWMI